MQTQAKCCVCFTKVNAKIFSAEPKLTLIPKREPSLSTIKLFLWLSAWSDELRSKPKTMIFLGESLSKPEDPALSTTLVAPNK